MTPSPVTAALPFLALVAVFGALALHFGAGRRRGLGRRHVLSALALLGAAPLVWLIVQWSGLAPERFVRVARPPFAVLTFAASLVVAARLARLARMTPLRRWLSEALVSASLLASGYFAMGLELGRPLDRQTVLVLVDRSRSIELVPRADALLRVELDLAERGMREEDRVGLVAFAAQAAVEDPPRPRSESRTVAKPEIGRDGTDIAQGIRRALAELPADTSARVVLVSDGVSTRGDPFAAAAAAAFLGVPIDVLPLDQARVPDIRVVSLRAPPRVALDENFELRLTTDAPDDAEIELRVKQDGVLVQQGRAKIGKGEDVLRMKLTAKEPGLHRFDVEVTALDPKLDLSPEDNAAAAFVRVRGPALALVLEGDPDKAKFVARALEAGGIRVRVAGPSAFPADLAELAAYDLLVLSDVRASDVGAAALEAVASFVKDLGGGLWLLGGDRSLGPGGYAKTPIEEVSPVSFDLKQDRRRSSLAEVISIDYSGSMGARVGSFTKLDLANEAAARSAMLLGPMDRLGVAHVDTTNAWTIPLGPVLDAKATAGKIKAVRVGGGGIYVDLALDEAYRALDAEVSNLKHLVLFADGDDAERLGGCRARVSAALTRGITTSVVALGHGKDITELEVLAKLGGGRYYLIEDATKLPAIFAQETILASRSAISEEAFVPSLGAPGAAVRGVDFSGAPPLKGYVITIPKGRASVHLTGPDGDPILATWSVGTGRVAVFTSDLKDRWGGAWTQFGGASRMVAQLARDIVRRPDDPQVRLESEVHDGQLSVRATVLGDDGRAESFRRLSVRIVGPDGKALLVPLEPMGPAAFGVTTPLLRPGAYVVSAMDDLSGEALATTGAVMSLGDELRPTGSDRALLHRLAAMTGGKERAHLVDAFQDRASPRVAFAPIPTVLGLLAGLALLLAAAARKLALTNPLSRRTPARPQAPRVSRDVERLKEAKRRSHDEARAATLAPHDDAPPPSLRARRPARPAAPATKPPGSEPERPRTAAEILLERRRRARETR